MKSIFIYLLLISFSHTTFADDKSLQPEFVTIGERPIHKELNGFLGLQELSGLGFDEALLDLRTVSINKKLSDTLKLNKAVLLIHLLMS